MAELPDDVYVEIERLCEEGNVAAGQKQYEVALQHFQAAWQLLPQPRTEWDAAYWLLVSTGDMLFLLKRYPEACDAFMDATKHFEEARSKPFIRLRLGQALYELGAEKESANWFAGAYLEVGKGLFANEDPKYLAFIKNQLKPPIGGWPTGW